MSTFGCMQKQQSLNDIYTRSHVNYVNKVNLQYRTICTVTEQLSTSMYMTPSWWHTVPHNSRHMQITVLEIAAKSCTKYDTRSTMKRLHTRSHLIDYCFSSRNDEILEAIVQAIYLVDYYFSQVMLTRTRTRTRNYCQGPNKDFSKWKANYKNSEDAYKARQYKKQAASYNPFGRLSNLF